MKKKVEKDKENKSEDDKTDELENTQEGGRVV